ncbi:MAG: alpha/beta hydrolase [Verrucomicrobiaceae bacterium]
MRLLLLFLLGTSLIRAQDPAANRALSDVPYKNGGNLTEYERERCKLDVYLPSTGKDWPVLVWFHGGGLKNGDKRGTPKDGVKTERIVSSLASAGIAVVSANYRFSPKVTFPAYLEDAAAAVAWAKQHMGEHGADPKRLFIGGHSAGGYITFMMGLDERFLKKEGMTLSDIAGLIPVSGQTMTHFTVREERGLAKHTITADEAAPVYHTRKDTPPMLVIYADKDMTARADENEFFIETMKGAGNKGVTGLQVANRTHGSIASEIAKEGDPARETILRFMGVAGEAR